MTDASVKEAQVTGPGDGPSGHGSPPTGGGWDRLLSQIADIPWGVILVAGLLGLNLTHVLQSDDIRAFAAAAGLLGVGHGIHTGAKSLAKRQGK